MKHYVSLDGRYPLLFFKDEFGSNKGPSFLGVNSHAMQIKL